MAGGFGQGTFFGFSRGIIEAALIQQVLMSNPPVEDYYTVLGVARDASADEIKRRFRKLARECHPDVAGSDPSAAARFNQIRQAYETLSDPEKRHLYDNPPRRRMAGGTFYRRSWRPPGGNRFDGLHNGSPGQTTRRARDSVRQRFNDPGNQLDLDDIFSDLGGGKRPHPAGGASSRGRRSGDPYADRTRTIHNDLRDMMNGGGASRATPPGPTPRSAPRSAPREAPEGDDITLSVEVPDHIARSGGTVSVKYPRLKRGERGDTLFRYDEIHELRVPPDSRHGQTLRVSRMGNAGERGGPYGDLVCRVSVVRRAPPHGDGTARARAAQPSTGDEKVVDISVVEAILGGRIELDTPSGRVRVTIPAGTSSDTRMRLRGRGKGGEDLFVRLRIVVPRALDAESRSLIEQFAALNPDSPRD